MALLKTRPRIRLLVPNEIRPGVDLVAVVVLECRREVDVQYVDFVFEGTETWTDGSGDSAVSRHSTLLRLGARLSGARTLPPGKTELPVRIPLSAHAPPSYRGTHVRIEYEARVHAAIEWWPDARAAFELHVAPLGRDAPPVEPGVYSSDPEGPRGSEPHVELSLASTWTRVGGVVSGALALSNVAQNRYGDVRVGLRAIETLYDASSGTAWPRDHGSFEIKLHAANAQEGEMIPFRFLLPAGAMPEYGRWPRPHGALGISSLSWCFELAVAVGWGGELTMRVPFRVLPASGAGEPPVRLAPPVIGSDRLRSVWETAGAPLGLRYEAQSLRGRVGETELVVWRDHTGRDGVHLVAELSYPELCLDLVVEPASPVRKLVGGGVRTGVAEWDREHYAVARDTEQAAIVLRALIPALRGARLRRLDDRALTVALRDSGQSRARLERFAAGAVHLARALERLRADLPPPTRLRDVVGEWRALERMLGATLEPARMRIAGHLGGHAAEVRLSFGADGEPLHTWLGVMPSVPFDAERALRWSVDDGPASDAIAAHYRGELRERLVALCDGARELVITRDDIALCLPAPLGLAGPDGAIVSVALAEHRLEQMAQLAALLRSHAGPYR